LSLQAATGVVAPGHAAPEYTAMRVSNAAALQVLAVICPLIGAVNRYQTSLVMVTPEPSSHDAGSVGVAFVAKVLVNTNAPVPTAVAVAQLSFDGAGVDVLKVNEYSLRVSVAR
jgi:hypothetical protein